MKVKMKNCCYGLLLLCICLASCTPARIPAFSTQHWHVDSITGNAVSSSGLELGFGSEWLITHTSLIQTPEQLNAYPALASFLADGISQFDEIVVDSIYFYNPHRGLLFVTYHQLKPLKPDSEISLYDETSEIYSKEYARIFGNETSFIDDDSWLDGPVNTVFTNVRFRPGKKKLVLLQRIPYNGTDIAVIQIAKTQPKKGKWWEDYPRGTFWTMDLGDPDNVSRLTSFLHSARSTAVANLRLASEARARQK